MGLRRDDWLDLARKLDWSFSYVDEREVYPELVSGRPWLPQPTWTSWNEPFRTSYAEYVANQHAKEASVHAVRAAVGGVEDFQRLDARWLSALKLHAAALPLAEFAAVIGNLRAARFGRDSAWRTTATLGALDEMAPSGRIVIACAFQAADEMRRVQRFAYRMRQLQDVDAAFGRDAAAEWHDDPMWQPLREIIEKPLVTYDWGEALVALCLAVKPRWDELFGTHLADLARRSGDDALGHVLGSLGEDCRWHRAWSAELIRLALRERPDNRQVIDAWLAKWDPLTARAIETFAPLFEAPVTERIAVAIADHRRAAELV